MLLIGMGVGLGLEAGCKAPATLPPHSTGRPSSSSSAHLKVSPPLLSLAKAASQHVATSKLHCPTKLLLPLFHCPDLLPPYAALFFFHLRLFYVISAYMGDFQTLLSYLLQGSNVTEADTSWLLNSLSDSDQVTPSSERRR